MPFTFNGCGTRYYGSRDTGPDGSFVTTEWITFAYLPIVPIRSMRVLPEGKETNLLIYNSQGYLTGKVPLAWTQVRNVYLITGPILAVILYFSWGDLSTWAKSQWNGHLPLHVQAAPPETPFDAASSAAACGSVMKLEAPAFAKFNLTDRISEVVKKSDFTAAELNNITSQKDLEETAFSAYSLGYLVWNKPIDPTRRDLGERMITRINTEAAKLSVSDSAILKVYAKKDLQMIMNSFDMGRHDARTSPCSVE